MSLAVSVSEVTVVVEFVASCFSVADDVGDRAGLCVGGLP